MVKFVAWLLSGEEGLRFESHQKHKNFYKLNQFSRCSALIVDGGMNRNSFSKYPSSYPSIVVIVTYLISGKDVRMIGKIFFFVIELGQVALHFTLLHRYTYSNQWQLSFEILISTPLSNSYLRLPQIFNLLPFPLLWIFTHSFPRYLNTINNI